MENQGRLLRKRDSSTEFTERNQSLLERRRGKEPQAKPGAEAQRMKRGGTCGDICDSIC